MEKLIEKCKDNKILVSLLKCEPFISTLKDFDCYINGGDEICTSKVIENNKHLKLISFMGKK